MRYIYSKRSKKILRNNKNTKDKKYEEQVIKMYQSDIDKLIQELLKK